MIRRMISFKLVETESAEEFMQRTNSYIKHLLVDNNIPQWDLVYHSEVFKWAGWMIRSNTANDLARAVLFHKNWAWIQIVASQNYGRQCHGRMLRTWRWERPLYKFLGEEWWTYSMDKDNWFDLLESFLKWRHTNP